VEGIRFIEFSDRDVVRHPLVQEVVRAYEANAARVAAQRLQQTQAALEPRKT
jgi:phosphate starvation-inducible PhoH-like protein